MDDGNENTPSIFDNTDIFNGDDSINGDGDDDDEKHKYTIGPYINYIVFGSVLVILLLLLPLYYLT